MSLPSSNRRLPRHDLLALALACAVLSPWPAVAASTPDGAARETSSSNDATPAQALDAVQVRERRLRAIGQQAGADQALVEQRKATHLSDVLEQVSGVSMNSLYARPEVSVGVQGLAGFGRVSQSLEGITQSFHAFTQDIGQTGSIFIEPQFLKSVEISRGVSSGSSRLGSLGGAADFRYLDVEDIIAPGRSTGGLLRGYSGITGSGNGQQPSGALFVGARNARWEFMLAAADAESTDYRVGSHFDTGDMLREFNATNLNYYDGVTAISSHDNCRYTGVTGVTGGFQDGLNNCMLTPAKLQRLEQAADGQALVGTGKRSDSQMLRLRHFFNDAHDQRLSLFANASHAAYETDQQPSIWQPLAGESGVGSWGRRPWSVATTLDRVASLAYSGRFSGWLNPDVTLFHEQQIRRQNWLGIPGSYAVNEPLHFNVDQKSTGLKLANASHFQAPWVGPLRLDASVELRRADKDVDSFSEEDFLKTVRASQGIDYTAQEWDANARNDSRSLALALSTESEGPWQASLGIGWQRQSLKVFSPRFLTGNIAQEGSFVGITALRALYRSQGHSSAQARAMAAEQVAINSRPFQIDPGKGDTRFSEDDKHHRFNLKSGTFALQYNPEGTGLTAYASLGYAERAPTSSEMYTSGAWMRQLFAGNGDLEPEQNVSLQVGARYERGDWLQAGDTLQASLGFYRNRIENYIGYGPMWMADASIFGDGAGSAGISVASVNNTAPVVRQGFELNLHYRQPSYYLRLAATLPLRHDNKMCSWSSPSEHSYYLTYDADFNPIYTLTGKGIHQCYSGWSWVATSAVEPLRASLTAAWTPLDGRLELGSSVHYRGHQRSAYWYVEEAQQGYTQASSAPLPDGDGWLTAYLWPKTIKVDLFANYRFNERFTVGMYLANLTNQLDGTSTSLGYNFYPGRTLTANLEYRF